jgi:hypothetical protein
VKARKVRNILQSSGTFYTKIKTEINKFPGIKFHEYPLRSSRMFMCVRQDRDAQHSFFKYVNAPTDQSIKPVCL